MKIFIQTVQRASYLFAACVLLDQLVVAQDTASVNSGNKVDTDRKIEPLDMLTVNVFGEEEKKSSVAQTIADWN